MKSLIKVIITIAYIINNRAIAHPRIMFNVKDYDSYKFI